MYGHGPAVAATLAAWIPAAYAEIEADRVAALEAVETPDEP